jgi:RYK receptor-like tyrosine kinase
MATELLKNPPLNGQSHAFNSATDIWAFGVLLWELFTCGQQPYGEMPTDEFAQAILYAGLRLSQPYNCPDELYAIMAQCMTI